jgi:hypothetical protein
MAHSGYHGAIVLEERARNTGENARFTYELLRQRDISAPNAVQIVTKPYMERRAKATFEAQWPDDMTRFRVVSRPHEFSDYVAEGHDADEITHKMVGICSELLSILRVDFSRYSTSQTRFMLPTPDLLQSDIRNIL